MTVTALSRARRAVAELLAAYEAAESTTEREAVAAVIARLTPSGARSLAELAAEALAAARQESTLSAPGAAGALTTGRGCPRPEKIDSSRPEPEISQGTES